MEKVINSLLNSNTIISCVMGEGSIDMIPMIEGLFNINNIHYTTIDNEDFKILCFTDESINYFKNPNAQTHEFLQLYNKGILSHYNRSTTAVYQLYNNLIRKYSTTFAHRYELNRNYLWNTYEYSAFERYLKLKTII